MDFGELSVLVGSARPLFFPALGMAIDCTRVFSYFGNLRASTPSRYCIGDMLFRPAKNRRQSRRQWATVPVLIRHRGSRIDGHSINISEGGMYLFAAAHLSPGTLIEIEFRRPNSKEVIRTCGAVRRRALYLYGIEFVSDDAATRDRTSVQTEIPMPSMSP
jgi:PilZ domain-containing protein